MPQGSSAVRPTNGLIYNKLYKIHGTYIKIRCFYPSDTFACNFVAYLFLKTSNSRNYASHTNHKDYTAYLDT